MGLDALCKDLSKSQNCLAIDSDNNNYVKPCSKYDTFNGPFYIDDENNIICGKEKQQWNDENDCRVEMCNLELDFARKVALLFESGYTRDDTFLSMNDKTYDNICVNLSEGGGSDNDRDIKCCGIGTERTTFNSMIHSCCNNELV